MCDLKTRANICAVGDICLGDHPVRVGQGVSRIIRDNGASFPFQYVKDILSKFDIVMGNMEYALFDYRGPLNLATRQNRGDKEFVSVIKDAGFNVMNMANNHIMQYGEGPFNETLNLLVENGIRVCGLRGEMVERASPLEIKVGGVDIVFLAYSLRPRQYFTGVPLYAEGTREGILADIRENRGAGRRIVVSLHWGDEFVMEPSNREVRFARELIDGGATLIVGHHPHVLRGVERYKQGLIAYSLGNFLCDMTWERRLRETFILSCSIGHDGIEEWGVTPAFINDSFQPEVNTMATEITRASIARLSNELESRNIDDCDDDRERYARKVAEELKIYRYNTHRYFLKNIHTYEKRIVYEQIRDAVLRRLYLKRD